MDTHRKRGFKIFNPVGLKFNKWQEERNQLVKESVQGNALLAAVQVISPAMANFNPSDIRP